MCDLMSWRSRADVTRVATSIHVRPRAQQKYRMIRGNEGHPTSYPSPERPEKIAPSSGAQPPIISGQFAYAPGSWKANPRDAPLRTTAWFLRDGNSDGQNRPTHENLPISCGQGRRKP